MKPFSFEDATCAPSHRRGKGRRALFTLATFCTLLAPVWPGKAVAQDASSRETDLKKFLQKYVGEPGSAEARGVRYSAAFVDLRDDGKQEAIVYLLGPSLCGSGGCPALVLRPEGGSYKIITRTSVTQTPIRVLSTKTNGWHDLGVWVQGGGIQPGYEARLKFNGKKYPGNPSVPPAQRLRQKVEGKVVISDRTDAFSSLW